MYTNVINYAPTLLFPSMCIFVCFSVCVIFIIFVIRSWFININWICAIDCCNTMWARLDLFVMVKSYIISNTHMSYIIILISSLLWDRRNLSLSDNHCIICHFKHKNDFLKNITNIDMRLPTTEWYQSLITKDMLNLFNRTSWIGIWTLIAVSHWPRECH